MIILHHINTVMRHRSILSRFVQSSTKLELLEKIRAPHLADTIATSDYRGIMTYSQLDILSDKLASQISSSLSLTCNTIAGLNCPNRNYVVSMITAWKLGKRFIPLCPSHPKQELEYFLHDSHANMILYSAPSVSNQDIIQKTDTLINSFGIKSMNIEPFVHSTIKQLSTASTTTTTQLQFTSINPHIMNDNDTSNCGLILYTSGTTGKPKGVLHTTSSINHMIDSLVQAWEYNNSDRILHFLPLHHLHGILNKLLCTLYMGGQIDFCIKTQPIFIWRKLIQEYPIYQQYIQYQQNKDIHKISQSIKNKQGFIYKPLTLFMAVPTIYAKMIEIIKKSLSYYHINFQQIHTFYSQYDNDTKLLTYMKDIQLQYDNTSSSSSSSSNADILNLIEIKQALSILSSLRLTVSGSAALSDTILYDWKHLTGHTLLERYGMTEIGMGLSNPYHGIRRAGHVGKPLPYITCKIVDDHGNTVNTIDTPGELYIKGPTVFREYLNKPEATLASFDSEHYFKTGDIVTVDLEGDYKILGRNSVDIIKSGGYKLSALEIERELLSHPNVTEAAVFGVPDSILGEKVIAVISYHDYSPSLSCMNTSDITHQQHIKNIHVHVDNNDDETKKYMYIISMIQDYLKDRIALYKQPRIYHIMKTIPRNHLGKVNKKSLIKELGY